MADILDNGGNTQDAERANEAILLTPLELLQRLGQAAWQLAKKGDEWGRAAFNDLEVGNKKLLPETTTPEDLEAVETAVQDPENAKVEVNAIATTEQGEVVRQPVADPWDEERTLDDKIVDELKSMPNQPVITLEDTLPDNYWDEWAAEKGFIDDWDAEIERQYREDQALEPTVYT